MFVHSVFMHSGKSQIADSWSLQKSATVLLHG